LTSFLLPDLSKKSEYNC